MYNTITHCKIYHIGYTFSQRKLRGNKASCIVNYLCTGTSNSTTWYYNPPPAPAPSFPFKSCGLDIERQQDSTLEKCKPGDGMRTMRMLMSDVDTAMNGSKLT